MKIKVLREVYRCLGKEYNDPKEAIIAAYKSVSDAHNPGVWIYRLAILEHTKSTNIYDNFFGNPQNTITGKYFIPSVNDIVLSDPEISRYSPVNGWETPKTVEVE